MPATVGQAIINARQVVPDMPNVLAPVAIITTGTAPDVAATLPNGTYDVNVTYRNAFGETIPVSGASGGPDYNQVIGANQDLTVNFGVGSTIPAGAQFIRVYLTMLPGSSIIPDCYLEVPAPSPATVFTSGFQIVIASIPINMGSPPSHSSAWLPDTDGGLISAAAIFGWLNDGLKMISRMAGGLLDYAGIPSQINQPLYVLPLGSHWIEITSFWYDGYWMMGGDRGQFFRRNTVTSSILSMATISVINNQMVLEVYPQPARTATSTTLASPMTALDTLATLTSTAGLLLPFGFIQVDSEQMAYGGINGNQVTGLIRGLGGSAAVAHLLTAPVQELNLFWNGKRQIDPAFAPGQSASILPIPNGWDVLLAQYISGRAKNIEHDGQYAKQLEDDIKASIKDWATNKVIPRRRQVGGSGQPQTYFGDIAGGLIVP